MRNSGHGHKTEEKEGIVDYTLEMFFKDYEEMLPMLKALRHVELPQEDWPVVSLNSEELREKLGMTSRQFRRAFSGLKRKGILIETGPGRYSICPNSALVDTLGFFRTKYGHSRGQDFSTRFMSVIWFVEDHRDALIEEGLVRRDERETMIRDELIRVILDSFSPPRAPAVFPTSTFEENHHQLSLPKVLEAVKIIEAD